MASRSKRLLPASDPGPGDKALRVAKDNNGVGGGRWESRQGPRVGGGDPLRGGAAGGLLTHKVCELLHLPLSPLPAVGTRVGVGSGMGPWQKRQRHWNHRCPSFCPQPGVSQSTATAIYVAKPVPPQGWGVVG